LKRLEEGFRGREPTLGEESSASSIGLQFVIRKLWEVLEYWTLK
jgi:hypothetical protein